MSISRGATRRCAADRMDEREILREEVLADDRAHGRAVAAGERARGLLELARAHVVGRRVDEIARQADPLDDAGEVVAVDVAGQLELQLLLILLAIAREAIAAEREGERRQLRIVRGIGEAVGARRDDARERSRPEQVLARCRREARARTGRRRGRRPLPAAGGGGRPSARSRRRPRRRARANRGRSRSSRQVAELTKVTGTVVAAWPRGRKIGCIGEPSLDVAC